MGKFWMVYGLGSGAPTMRHETRSMAEDEARRLARNAPNITFFVLETVSVAKKVDVTLRRLDDPSYDDEMPF